MPILFNPVNENADAWADRYMENAPGNFASSTPVLVDKTIPSASTDLYVANACRFPTPIFHIEYQGKDHRPLMPAAEADFTA